MRTLRSLAVVGLGFVVASLGACSLDGAIGGPPGEGARGADADVSSDAGADARGGGGHAQDAATLDAASVPPTSDGGAGSPRDDAGSTGTSNDAGGANTDDAGAIGPSADSGATTPSDPVEAARQLCVDTINAYRATLGLPAYARWTDDESCVDGQAAADGAANTAHSAFGTCNEFAQNECPGWPGPPSTLMTGCLQMMWNEGPGSDFEAHGHYINMSSTSYSMVACGFHQMADGSWWATQDFK